MTPAAGRAFSRTWCKMRLSLVAAGFGLALLPASAKAVSVENVVYVDILDRLRESELTLVCHRIIRSEVLKKFLVTLDHT